MSYSNGIITAPVSIDDVKTALGVSTNDVAALCTSDKINMWAKYKPTKKNAIFTDDWWKGDDFNAGISIPYTEKIENVLGYYNLNDGTDNGWSYRKPTGGASSPYRLGDFRGYNRNARSPLGAMSNVPEQRTITGSFIVTLIFSPKMNADEIPLSSVSAVAQTYFGCIMYDSSNNFYAIRTIGTKISDITEDDAFGIEMKWSSGQFSVGTYKVIPVLSSRAYTTMVGNSGLASGVNYYPLPTGEVKTIKFIATSTALTNHVGMRAERNGTSVKVTINVDSSGHTYTGIVVYLSTTNYSSGVVSDGQWNVGTIGAGGKYSHTFIAPSATAMYRVLLYSNGTKQFGVGVIETGNIE